MTESVGKGQRYLMVFSYLGFKYSGTQRQTPKVPKPGVVYETDNSIQHHLESGLKYLKPQPVNEMRMLISSRTDAGVNALLNSCHFNLIHPKNSVYKPHSITQTLNQYLWNNEHNIVVRRTVAVSSMFNCSLHSKWRLYTYRIALIKPEAVVDEKPKSLIHLLPFAEHRRCFPLYPKNGLNLKKMNEVCKVFCGTHDFTSFCAKSSDHHRSTIRTIDECSVKLTPGYYFSTFDPLYNNIDIIEFRVKSSSFLYKQIRRMVGVTIAVGRGSLSVNAVQELLDDPYNNFWQYQTAPPYGLYLTHIEYDEKEFLNPTIFRKSDDYYTFDDVEENSNELMESDCESEEDTRSG